MCHVANVVSPAYHVLTDAPLSDGFAMIGTVHQYTFRAEWSPKSEEYVGMCIELPSRYSRASTAHEAIAGIERVIEEEVAEMGLRRDTAGTCGWSAL